MKRLGINIDHVATLRNARGERHPDPFKAAKYALNSGANSITIHLREDRRHILDNDTIKLCSKKNIKLNLEIAPNKEMLKIALRNKPNYVCIVPENRKEITTEGGLNIKKNKKKIKEIVLKLNKNKIRTSLFVNPNLNDIKLTKETQTNCIEIHTGKLSNLIKLKKNYKKEFFKIIKTARFAKTLGLEVHAGHGIDYKTAKILSRIPEITEFNIGHFVIGESIFYGLKKVIKKFKMILK